MKSKLGKASIIPLKNTCTAIEYEELTTLAVVPQIIKLIGSGELDWPFEGILTAALNVDHEL